MRQHQARTWWVVAIGAVLLLLGVWLATMTMKRHERLRTCHAGSWTGLVKHAK
jgi:hypothetical protein